MADNFQLEIVTPEHKVVSESVTAVEIPSRNGYLGILPGHAPLITELSVGEIMFNPVNGKTQYLALAWGFAEVLPDKVTILAEVAERPAEVDRTMAETARAEAQQRLAQDLGNEEAMRELELANIRLKVANRATDGDVANIVP